MSDCLFRGQSCLFSPEVLSIEDAAFPQSPNCGFLTIELWVPNQDHVLISKIPKATSVFSYIGCRLFFFFFLRSWSANTLLAVFLFPTGSIKRLGACSSDPATADVQAPSLMVTIYQDSIKPDLEYKGATVQPGFQLFF